MDYVGYAHAYIKGHWNDSTLENEAKLEVYKILFRIDQRLGTTTELQLWNCCFFAVNINIIEVIENKLIIQFNLFSSFSKNSSKLTSNSKKKEMVRLYLISYSSNVLNIVKQTTGLKRH